jgi:hypothetical protein
MPPTVDAGPPVGLPFDAFQPVNTSPSVGPLLQMRASPALPVLTAGQFSA